MKRYIAVLLTAVLTLCSIPVSLAAGEITLHVSPNGNDYNDGTEAAPYKTLRRAAEVVWNLRRNGQSPSGLITVVLKEGDYILEDSLYLDSRGSNIRFVAEGEVTVSGGAKIGAESFTEPDTDMLARFPEEARESIRCVDLSPYVKELDLAPNITSDTVHTSDYIVSQGDSYMIAARWPNKGVTAEDGFMSIKTVYNSAATGVDSVVIGYGDERISQWKTPTDITMEGYGSYLYTYQKLRLAGINSAEKKITAVEADISDGFYKGGSVWFSNVAEELDLPGEYYLDRSAKKLYFYPADNEESLTVSLMKKPLVHLLNAENVSFEGITFENTRADGVLANGCRSVAFDNCTMRRTGGYGVRFNRSSNSGVRNSLITETGCGGVGFFGGGRKYDLTPSANFAENNEICDFAKVKTTYSPAVYTNGIGDTVSYNTIHEAFHTAIYFSGNDNLFSHNEIYNVLLGTSDAGAMYTIADASSRRNRIENNFFHHLGEGTQGYQQSGIFAIYFDCLNSGNIVKNNLFYDMPAGIQVNGGGYHSIENNIFSHVSVPVFSHVLNNVPNASAWPAYINLNKDTAVWEEKYPELASGMPSDAAGNYTGNVLKNNLFASASSTAPSQITASGITQENNIEETEEIFTNRHGFDFSLAKPYSGINELYLTFGVQ